MPNPPPPFSTLTVTSDGSVGRLTLDQPERLNPLGAVALRELAEAARWLDTTDVTVVVVQGAGRAFSAGFDLREFAAPPSAPSNQGEAAAGDTARPDAGTTTPQLGAEMAEAIAGMRAVTIASIRGACVGGGFVLALCCDLRLASSDAWFSLPESELGIPLAWTGVPRLVREIGPARTIELVLSARRIDATEAAAFGLLNRVVAPDALDATVAELTDQLAARRPEVVTTTKRQVHDAAEALVPTGGDWAGTQHLVDALRALLAER